MVHFACLMFPTKCLVEFHLCLILSLLHIQLLIDKFYKKLLCNFIADFDKVIEKLCDDSHPTLHQVIPYRQHLVAHCSNFESDKDDDLNQIKKIIGIYQFQLCY